MNNLLELNNRIISQALARQAEIANEYSQLLHNLIKIHKNEEPPIPVSAPAEQSSAFLLQDTPTTFAEQDKQQVNNKPIITNFNCFDAENTRKKKISIFG